MRVLVVEDDFDLSGALMRLLTRRGFLATHCGDATSALQALQQSAFELVVLDLGLPGMDGLQLLQRLQRRGGVAAVRGQEAPAGQQAHERAAQVEVVFDDQHPHRAGLRTDRDRGLFRGQMQGN